MNQKINEIIERSGLYIAYENKVVTEKELEYFTELLIREFHEMITGLIVPETSEQDIGNYEYWNRALNTATLELEQLFGVKE